MTGKRDPRGSHRYKTTRAAWKPQAPTVCALCGQSIDLDLPTGLPASWTVEHRLPIRTILTMTDTWDQAVTMACDTTLWASAHKACQDAQGGAAAGRRTKPPTQFRDW